MSHSSSKVVTITMVLKAISMNMDGTKRSFSSYIEKQYDVEMNTARNTAAMNKIIKHGLSVYTIFKGSSSHRYRLRVPTDDVGKSAPKGKQTQTQRKRKTNPSKKPSGADTCHPSCVPRISSEDAWDVCRVVHTYDWTADESKYHCGTMSPKQRRFTLYQLAAKELKRRGYTRYNGRHKLPDMICNEIRSLYP
eukprot:107795_1